MSENLLSSIVKRISQGMQPADQLVCIISKSWFKSLINYLSGSSHPGKIETPKPSEDYILISQEDFNSLVHVFSGGPKLMAFLLDGSLDYSLLEIQVCINDSIWKTYQISLKLSVSRLKNYLCDCEDLEAHKVRIRLIEETQGTIAYRALPETSTLESLNLRPGVKISLDKPIKRLVKFVESEDEEDKVVEICVKHKNSTVPSTSCPSESHETIDFESTQESNKKKGFRHRLRVQKLDKVLKNIKKALWELEC